MNLSAFNPHSVFPKLVTFVSLLSLHTNFHKNPFISSTLNNPPCLTPTKRNLLFLILKKKTSKYNKTKKKYYTVRLKYTTLSNIIMSIEVFVNLFMFQSFRQNNYLIKICKSFYALHDQHLCENR